MIQTKKSIDALELNCGIEQMDLAEYPIQQLQNTHASRQLMELSPEQITF
jgi:hypothetical protein